MPSPFQIPSFRSTRRSLSQLGSELDSGFVVVPVHQGQLNEPAWLEGASGGELSAAGVRGEFVGKLCDTWTGQLSNRPSARLLVLGAGPAKEMNAEKARRVGACITLTARRHRRSRLVVLLPPSWSDALVEVMVEGATIGNYDNGHYKSRSEERFFVEEIEVSTDRDLAQAVERGRQVGEAVNAARTLINEPGNRLTPHDFVSQGQSLLDLPDVSSEVLDPARMEQLGMGLLLGVGRGSAEPPRMLVARYEPVEAPAAPVLGLIGKGITFDTGGISIKPADGMERMKDDMAGGATVIAALRAIALERLPLRVIAIVPSAENMPGSKATKPGDVHRGASGLTVEINNTDAEGRLILGDGLWYAKELGATHLIDVATLTGACIVALGKITTGLFGTDGWIEVVRDAASRGGEKVWALPTFDDYREPLKSEIADMLNSPGRAGGAITAAMFLKEFVGTTPWAHLDIAGTAWAEDAKPWAAKGATGVMIKTLLEVARTAGQQWP